MFHEAFSKLFFAPTTDRSTEIV